MMKKEMILPASSVRSGQYSASRPSVFAALSKPLTPGVAKRACLCACLIAALKGYCLRGKAVRALSAFYSRLLEARVTPLQTLHLLHAQLAFFLMVFPLPFSPFVRFLCLGWFALAAARCRRAGL